MSIRWKVYKTLREDGSLQQLSIVRGNKYPYFYTSPTSKKMGIVSCNPNWTWRAHKLSVRRYGGGKVEESSALELLVLTGHTIEQAVAEGEHERASYRQPQHH